MIALPVGVACCAKAGWVVAPRRPRAKRVRVEAKEGLKTNGVFIRRVSFKRRARSRVKLGA